MRCFHNVCVGARVVDEVIRVEQEVEVLGGLGQEERLHPVVQGVGQNIFHSSISTRGVGRMLDAE